MNVKKIGDTTVGEAPESGAITVSDIVTRTIVERGMYDDLYARLPQRGDQWGQEEWWVTGASLAPNPGGTGTLTTTLADTPESAGGDVWSPGSPPIYEVNWTQIEKPLTANSKLNSGYTGSTLQTVIDEIEAWRNSPQQRKRKYQIPAYALNHEPNPNTDADWITLTGAARNIAQKIAKGIEGYLVFSPVISRTTVSRSRPSTSGGGKIEDPPISVGDSPTGKPYVYLRVGDIARQQQDGTWQRIEQWQGAEEWDTDIYGSV
jgi:Ni/Co efflux regulator RcnB